MTKYDCNCPAILVDYDADTRTYEIHGAATVEDWGEVVTEVSANDGHWTKRADLTGWEPWTEAYDLHIPIGGGWMDMVYFVGPGASI